MPASYLTQYQILAQPPSPASIPERNAAVWIYPWSEPVRQRIAPVLAIALIASGIFAPTSFPGTQPGPSNAAPWLYAWSEPVRIKVGLRPEQQQVLAFDPLPRVSFGWPQWLSEPVRQKPGLGAWLQRFDSLQTPIQPNVANLLEGWYNWFSEPVRTLAGLKAHLQQTLAYHPRILPTPNVTVTMSATETNSDVAEFAINVYTGSTPVVSGQGANVSLEEIPIPGNSRVSNKGN